MECKLQADIICYSVCYSAVLHPIKIQDSEKDASPRATRKETKSKQVCPSLICPHKS